MDWLNLVSMTIAMSACDITLCQILRICCAGRTHSLKAATGLGYLLALVSGRLSSLFVSALLASVRSDEERWSFFLLLPLARVTAGALMSSSTPDIESL